MAYGSRVIQRDLDFTVNRGDVFVIMGGSGCGKSTLLKHMIGLLEPAAGDVLYDGASFQQADAAGRDALRRRWGITYQGGGLFSAMTLADNVALPLQQYTPLDAATIADAKLKIKGDTFKLDAAGQNESGTLAFDAKANPKTLEVSTQSGDTIPAIYELNGVTLKICYAVNSAARPKEFKSTSGSDHVFVVYQRP